MADRVPISREEENGQRLIHLCKVVLILDHLQPPEHIPGQADGGVKATKRSAS